MPRTPIALPAVRVRGLLPRLAVVALALAAAVVAVEVLEHGLGLANAAPVFFLAVVAVAITGGTGPAIATAIGSFLLYDLLFVSPVLALTVADPSEWLDLLLFLAVAVAIGQLAASLAERAEEVAERGREAETLYRISRLLATTEPLDAAAPLVLRELAGTTGFQRAWLGIGPTPAAERRLADTGTGQLTGAVWQVVLQRPRDAAPRWIRTHVAGVERARDRPGTAPTVHRVRVEVGDEVVGSIAGLANGGRDPGRAETRILASAADQLGQAVRRQQLAAEALEVEVARRSEALKGALLDSVSHDLRTPLATIRAAAGSLLDESVAWSPTEAQAALRSIDGEAERMNRLVRNLLDLSRIEGGALRPDLEPHDLDDLLAPLLRRLPPANHVTLDLPADLPPVLVDDTLVDAVLANVLENAVRHGGSTIRVRAREADAATIEVTVEDDGPGVPGAALPHLFEKFYRVPVTGQGSGGMGVGLAIAQGLTRAMGGEISAAASPLGGLAVRLRLPNAGMPADDDADEQDLSALAGSETLATTDADAAGTAS